MDSLCNVAELVAIELPYRLGRYEHFTPRPSKTPGQVTGQQSYQLSLGVLGVQNIRYIVIRQQVD